MTATKSKSSNLNKLQDSLIARSWVKQVIELIKNEINVTSNLEQWKNMKVLKTSAKNNLGYLDHKTKRETHIFFTFHQF